MPKIPIIIPVADLRGEHDRQLLRLIARGEKEIEAGKGFDLDAVLADADVILGEATTK